MNFSTTRVQAFILLQMREFFRDFGTVFLNLAFPLLFVFALIISDLSNPTFKFKIGLVDERQDHTAQNFVETLVASPGMEVKNISRGQVDHALKNGDVHTAFIIPAVSDTSAAAASDSTGLGEIELVVSPRYEDFSRILLDAARDRMNQAAGVEPLLFDYRVHNPDSEVRSEFTFTFPGLLSLALVQLGLFATAVPLLQARDRGTLRYLSLTPLSVAEILAGQLSMRVVIALVQVLLILAAGSTVLELLPWQWFAVTGVALLGILLLVSIGYAIAGAVTSMQMGMAVILVANFTMLMGGNIFIDANASTAQYVIACLIPISFLSDMFRQVITEQNGLWPLWLDAVMILFYSAVAIVIALRTFNFDTVKRSAGGRGWQLRRAGSV